MREPGPEKPVFGIMAEFDRPERLIEAARVVSKARFRAVDAYTPFPIEELTEIIGLSDKRVPILTAVGGLLGAVLGFGLQVYTNLSFPIDVGGRPLIATPGFMMITFELGVLGAVLTTIIGMLLLNRLPRLHHPVFDVDTFHLASMDKFFLIILSTDKNFDEEGTREFLMALKPRRVDLLTQPAVAP